MKKLSSPFVSFFFFLIVMILFLLPSCNRVSSRTVCVGFQLEHPDFKVIEPIFDTITETVLVTETHNEGATFETVTEQVLIKEEHTKIKLVDIQYLNIVSDIEDGFSCAMPCITYLKQEDFELTTVGNEYTTRSYQRVAINGTGALVQAQYTDREFYRLKTDATFVPGGSMELEELQKTLSLPDTIDFKTHWKRQLKELNAEACGDSTTYRVIY